MTETQALRLARGPWQREILRDMLHDSAAHPTRALRGRARSYRAQYERSFRNLVARLAGAGITVLRAPGPRGGDWNARYVALLPHRD
ncbi:MAG: hypothetical protein C4521_07580 [Actinobacteria bacterium]|nr:MAG: hypothetical protein C4521_07580 [Actinomycetota bacterium]